MNNPSKRNSKINVVRIQMDAPPSRIMGFGFESETPIKSIELFICIL